MNIQTEQGRPERISTAYHEAGHAALHIFYGHDLQGVRIISKGAAAGYTDAARTVPAKNRSERFQVTLEFISALQAGMIAEHNAPGLQDADGVGERGIPDREEIAKLLRNVLVTGSDEEARPLQEWLAIRTRGILARIWPAVEAIAAELKAEGVLSGARAAELYRAALNQGRA